MMRRGIAAAVLAITLMLGSGPAQAGPPKEEAAPWQTLTGSITHADFEHYREVPFDLPEGVTRLTIRFTYGGKDQRSVIDLGLADPQRLRGWSGGARDHMTLSTEEATPGYLPGPLPAGRWRLILGVPNIREGVAAPFEAKVYIERGPAVTALEDVPIHAAPGWYRGDLHMHSGNSDGSCRAQSGAKTPCPVYRTVEAAAARGLDFIALTDHNSTSHFAALRALQGAFDRMLLLPGREITTFFGHANVFGPTGPLDFRMSKPSYTEAARWLDTARQAGGIVSLNHAGLPSGEACMGCGWRVADLPPGAVGAVEVVNGGTLAQTGQAEGPLQGVALWHKLLNRGQHVTGIGGSDNHNPDIPADKPGAIGTPTTVIHMDSLSTQGFMEGIRAGRAFVDVEGTHDRLLDISASSGRQTAGMGGTIHVKKGARLRIVAWIQGLPDGRIDYWLDGHKMLTRDAMDARPFDWSADGRRHWVRADGRGADGRLMLIGNAIYIEPGD